MSRDNPDRAGGCLKYKAFNRFSIATMLYFGSISWENSEHPTKRTQPAARTTTNSPPSLPRSLVATMVATSPRAPRTSMSNLPRTFPPRTFLEPSPNLVVNVFQVWESSCSGCRHRIFTAPTAIPQPPPHCLFHSCSLLTACSTAASSLLVPAIVILARPGVLIAGTIEDLLRLAVLVRDAKVRSKVVLPDAEGADLHKVLTCDTESAGVDAGAQSPQRTGWEAHGVGSAHCVWGLVLTG